MTLCSLLQCGGFPGRSWCRHVRVSFLFRWAPKRSQGLLDPARIIGGRKKCIKVCEDYHHMPPNHFHSRSMLDIATTYCHILCVPCNNRVSGAVRRHSWLRFRPSGNSEINNDNMELRIVGISLVAVPHEILQCSPTHERSSACQSEKCVSMHIC